MLIIHRDSASVKALRAHEAECKKQAPQFYDQEVAPAIDAALPALNEGRDINSQLVTYNYQGTALGGMEFWVNQGKLVLSGKNDFVHEGLYRWVQRRYGAAYQVGRGYCVSTDRVKTEAVHIKLR